MKARRRSAPVWLMGLCNMTYGLYGGIVIYTLPQLLSGAHVPETTIATMTAVVLSPGFWTFLFSPMLDVRFSRRWYSLATAGVAAGLLVVGLMNIRHLVMLESVMVLGFFSACLCQSALGGWLSTVTTADEANQLSVWITIGNVAGGGAVAYLGAAMVRSLPLHSAALLLGTAVMLPTLAYPWIPAPGPDRRLAKESFVQFFGDVMALVRRREVLVAIVIAITPAATFSLTNFLSGVGNDFHASPHFVGLIGGGGALVGGLVGCLVFPKFSRLLPLRLLYLSIGVLGAIFTLGLILLPRTPTTFAVGWMGECLFQGFAITNMTAIAFETIGRKNPLASTTFCLIISAYSVPISYMLVVDGAGYSWRGVTGSYLADAGSGIVASVLLGLMLLWLGKRRRVVVDEDVEISVELEG